MAFLLFFLFSLAFSTSKSKDRSKTGAMGERVKNPKDWAISRKPTEEKILFSRILRDYT